jgi:hypothetical protein
MPIKFRCQHCRQFLGISRSKAGEVTDCPTCGKSIRVPNLDGTIDDIPAPTLDLRDAELADALAELAETPQTVVRPTVEVYSGRPAVADVGVVRTEPVAVTPRTTPKPIATADYLISAADTLDQDAGTKVNAEQELRTLSQSGPRDRAAPTAVSGDPSQNRRQLLLLLGPAVIVIGLLLVAAFVRPGRQAASASGPGAEEESSRPAVVAAPAPQEGTLVGTVTFLAEDGVRIPDSGARVILLPAERRGTLKFDVAGFLAGGDEVDGRAAAAALRILGGDVVSADDDGRFELLASEATTYRLLVISRHCPRPLEEQPDEAVQELLSAYWLRPASLLGGLAFHTQQIERTGNEPLPTVEVTFQSPGP